MKTKRSTLTTMALLSALLLALLASCFNVLGLKGEMSAKYGSLKLATSGSAESSANARTLRPGGTDIQVAQYLYHLVAPDGTVTDDSDTAGSKTFSPLMIGAWSAAISAKNASGVVLLNGSTNFTIVAGQAASVTVDLAAATGYGSVNIAFSFPSIVASVSGTITNEATPGSSTGIASKLTYDAATGSGTYTDSLAAGTYSLTLDLKDSANNVVGTVTEDVDVFANITTNPQITLSASDLNHLPAAPVTPSVARLGDDSVTLALTPVLGATGYNVYYAPGTTATTADPKAAGSPFATTTAAIPGLSNQTEYAFVVTALNSAGESGSSGVLTATTLGAPPSTPSYSLAGGSYSGPQTVSIASSAGATIRYTIDGSLPTSTHGTVYVGAVYVGGSITIQAIAYQSGRANSDIGASVYRISNYALGDTGPAGGIIFYDNPNWATDGWRYLEAAPTDQSTGIGSQWASTYVPTGATATAIGTGKANTADIVTAQGSGSYAAQLCNDLTLGGYSDWFLPSEDELNAMYQEKSAIGSFGYSIYWSSTENSYGDDKAMYENFTTGYWYAGGKDGDGGVRAVREF